MKGLKPIHVFYGTPRLRKLAEKHFRHIGVTVVSVEDYDLMAKTTGLPPIDSDRVRYLSNTMQLDTEANPGVPAVVMSHPEGSESVKRAFPDATLHTLHELDEDFNSYLLLPEHDPVIFVNEPSFYVLLSSVAVQ